MAVVVDLDDEEAYLYAILSDVTGIDLAEFEFHEPNNPDGVYRLFDYQWELNDSEATFQATQGARNTGKSYGVQMRCAAFPWNFPGMDRLLTGPELNHLKPLTTAVEERLKSTWLLRQMLPISTKSDGFSRNPHWECRFVNGSKIVSRLPNIDGRGVKGQHAVHIELDEAQDYPKDGWKQIVECLNRATPGAQWRCHGVPRGVRDTFYDITQGVGASTSKADKLVAATAKDVELQQIEAEEWIVHRPMAMNRPSWSRAERNEKIKLYNGSRQTNEYKCNIYGDHGDSANAVFVTARLVACTDLIEGTEYNADVYKRIAVEYETLDGLSAVTRLYEIPGTHKVGWAKAPQGYASYHVGADIGGTNDPTEILVFGQRKGVSKEMLDLLLRVHLQRIELSDQLAVCKYLFEWYGAKLLHFGVDRTGLGLDMSQRLEAAYPKRALGVNFSEKGVVGIEDRELKEGESPEDLHLERNLIEQASDELRWIVDAKAFHLPNDRELLTEWQGQTYTTGPRSAQNPYGKRTYSKSGGSHTLDAAKVMIAAKRHFELAPLLEPPEDEPILDRFPGA